jgi:hypothetical protein
MTAEEIRICEMVVALVRQAIAGHMDGAPYCDQGPNAYRHAQDAVDMGIQDVQKLLDRMRSEINTRGV